MNNQFRSDADIVAAFEQRAKAAVATLEAQRDRAQREMTGSAALTEATAVNLFFAEAIAQQFHAAGARDNGTLFRSADDTDASMVERLRSHRRTLIKKLLFTPENPWPGFGAVQQHYRREGAKRFLTETTFVRAEGEL